MQRNILSRVLVIIAASIVVGPVLAAQPTVESTGPVASVQDPLSLAAAQAGGLCGLTPSSIADIVEYYGFEPDPGALAAAATGPFDCDAYGDLCDGLTTPQAHTYACGVWLDLEAQRPFNEVRERAVGRVTTWGNTCSPDPEVCEDICSPADVGSCMGVLLGGACYPIAICEFGITLEIPFFEFLGPLD